MGKIKILILLGDLNRCNGITSFVMNYYKHINKDKFKIDFIITNDDVDIEYKKIIEKNKSSIYYIKAPQIKSVFEDLKRTKRFLKEHLKDYDIFYCHLVNKGYFYLKYAGKLGFNKRIFHSHAIVMREKNKIRDFRNQLFKHLVSKQANYYFACSRVAGEDLLGKNGQYTIINNAIEVKKYIYDESIRKKVRTDLNITNSLVFIQVGRLVPEKNPYFTLDLFKKIKEDLPHAILLFVGSGYEDQNLKKYIVDNKISDVTFLGTRSDINELLIASDVHLFPSKFEGLGMAAIEAQISGLPSYLSSTIPQETKILDTTYHLDLDLDLWRDTILNTYRKTKRGDYSSIAKKNGYDIDNEVKKLENILQDISNE